MKVRNPISHPNEKIIGVLMVLHATLIYAKMRLFFGKSRKRHLYSKQGFGKSKIVENPQYKLLEIQPNSKSV